MNPGQRLQMSPKESTPTMLFADANLTQCLQCHAPNAVAMHNEQPKH